MRRPIRGSVSATFALVAACASGPDPEPEVRPVAATSAERVALRGGWHGTLVIDRSDSIILTLPSGGRQTQHFVTAGWFALQVGPDNDVTLHLDSVQTRTPLAKGGSIGGTWTGRWSGAQFETLNVPSGRVQEWTGAIRTLFPRLPAGGVPPGTSWSDSANTTVRVDIFTTTEYRTARWSSGTRTNRAGAAVMPLRVSESYEQLGSGSQGGHDMSMTAQGRRMRTYYLTMDGRLDSAVLTDSSAMLISIPKTRQVIPTMRYTRTTLRVLASPE